MSKSRRREAGPASFCVPRAAVAALLAEQASAYEICTYLTLACFTDATGVCSTAGVHAVNAYTGANKTNGGPIARAIERLKTIRAATRPTLPVDRNRRSLDLGTPILHDRAGWLALTGEELPAATPQTTVRYVLPDFGEPLSDRVWFGSNLVRGVGEFHRPLKALKNAGNEAARLLLALYEINDMETWGGVVPHDGPWVYYGPSGTQSMPARTYAERLANGTQLLRWRREGKVSGVVFTGVWKGPSGRAYWEHHDKAGGPVWRALEALEGLGLVYEVVLVINRKGQLCVFPNGTECYSIPHDGEPLYELGARNHHGWAPQGEQGLGGLTARTAGELGYPVTEIGGRFSDCYAALVRPGYGAMVAGIYRLRFRPSNPKNAGVSQAWGRIYSGNRDAFDFIRQTRAAFDLSAVASPFHEAPKAETRPRRRARKALKIPQEPNQVSALGPRTLQ